MNKDKIIKEKKVIGCDIGGVLKNMIDRSVYLNAVETLSNLSKQFEIIFISKCKESYKKSNDEWLKDNSLSEYKIFYCEKYGDKIAIANKNKVDIMIDDRMQVLSTIPSTIIKYGFVKMIRN